MTRASKGWHRTADGPPPVGAVVAIPRWGGLDLAWIDGSGRWRSATAGGGDDEAIDAPPCWYPIPDREQRQT